jgi:hypothetical protein
MQLDFSGRGLVVLVFAASTFEAMGEHEVSVLSSGVNWEEGFWDIDS